MSTIAGNGTAGLVNGASPSAEFKAPQGLTIDSQGDVYVADTGNSTVRFISTSGQASSIARDGTVGSNDSPEPHFDVLARVGFFTTGGSQIVTLGGSFLHACWWVTFSCGFTQFWSGRDI